ncbi:MAG TPA: hypothetical protein VGF67_05860 [Ktedonobacteraceae bacterium]|jgi:hypothetical protein
MEQAHEEEIMRITAEFMAEQEAGRKPRLEEYARRYPQYVDEIADFVTYYYAVEAGLPTDTTSVPSLSAGSRAALDLAWERTTEPLTCHALTLAALARRRRYTLARLAAALDLSDDIVVQLARRQVEPETIPREILQRLSRVLSQSLSVVRQTLGLPEVPSTPLPVGEPARSGLPAFREALVASLRLSAAQKERWLAVLEREGL